MTPRRAPAARQPRARTGGAWGRGPQRSETGRCWNKLGRPGASWEVAARASIRAVWAGWYEGCDAMTSWAECMAARTVISTVRCCALPTRSGPAPTARGGRAGWCTVRGGGERERPAAGRTAPGGAPAARSGRRVAVARSQVQRGADPDRHLPEMGARTVFPGVPVPEEQPIGDAALHFRAGARLERLFQAGRVGALGKDVRSDHEPFAVGRPWRNGHRRVKSRRETGGGWHRQRGE